MEVQPFFQPADYASVPAEQQPSSHARRQTRHSQANGTRPGAALGSHHPTRTTDKGQGTTTHSSWLLVGRAREPPLAPAVGLPCPDGTGGSVPGSGVGVGRLFPPEPPEPLALCFFAGAAP